MTPREPDRFEAKARELYADDCPHQGMCLAADCPVCLAAALRQAADEALERAAYIAESYGCDYAGREIRALASPAAAPAAETAQQENRRFTTWTGPSGKQATTEEWLCPDCGGWHVVGLGGIRVGHPCPRTQPAAGALEESPK